MNTSSADAPPRRSAARRIVVWLIVLLALGALVALGWRNVVRRDAERQAQLQPPAPPMVALAAADVAVVQRQRFLAELPISGTLQAVHSATVKARVAGDIRELTLREGDRVQAGQLIARVNPAEYNARVRQAEQQARASDAQVALAQRQRDNNRALVEEGFISKTALANSQAELDAALASTRAAQAAAEAARQTLQDTQLLAPIDGQIAQRLVAPGDYVTPGAPVVEIVDLSELELQVPLSPADSVLVRIGQEAQLSVEGHSEPVAATVARINPSTQPGSRSVLAYLRVAGSQGLRQGLFARGTLATSEQEALLVPLTTVRSDQPEPYVQVAQPTDDGGHAIAHLPVTVVTSTRINGETMVAVDGVADGDIVLRAAAGRLAAGAAVQLADSPPAAANAR